MLTPNEMNVASDNDLAVRFDPAVFSAEAAATLRSMLDQGFYRDALRLPKPSRKLGLSELAVFLDYYRKRSNCWGESALANFYRKRLSSEKGPATVNLFDLFWMAQPIQEDILYQFLSEDQLKILSQASIISRQNGVVRPQIRCIAPPSIYAMFDIDRSSTSNFVYFGTDSQDLVQIIQHECAGRRFGRSLDLCTGSGVQGLTLAKQSEEVICTDLNERALSYVKANASLNAIENVRALESNLFSNITGRFDCITANTPYVPMPDDAEAKDLPMRGGNLGIEFTFELLEQLPDYLNPGGMAVIYTSDPIVENASYLPYALSNKFGELPFEFTQRNIFRSYPNTERQRQHFREHKMQAFDDCVLVVRHSSRYSFHQRAWHPSFYWRSRLLHTNYASDPAV